MHEAVKFSICPKHRAQAFIVVRNMNRFDLHGKRIFFLKMTTNLFIIVFNVMLTILMFSIFG